MARTLSLVLATLLMVLWTVLNAGEIPADADGVPTEVPEDLKPEVGWSLRNLDPEQQQRMLRFSTFVNGDIPETYLEAENRIGYTVPAIAAGGPLYLNNCQGCHGDTGLGNGNLAYALKPSPALLAYMVQQPIAVDQYLMWSIAEGGKRFGTAMPAFKDKLSREQIWQIVAYLRAGFPDLAGEGSPETRKGPGAATTDEPDPRTHTID
jgi:mono/diheme cytochrome c family protein